MREKLINEIFELGKKIRNDERGEGLKSDELKNLNEKSLQVIVNLRNGVLKKKS